MTGRAKLAVAYTVLVLLAVLVLFPFYWMTITSFKSEDQMRSLVSMFWPRPLVTENYSQLLSKTDFVAWYGNSATVALSSTLLATAVGTIGAYALARLRFLGRSFLASATLITYLVPPSILFIPLYAQMRNLGLANSLAGLIAAYPSFTVPFVTWLLMGYFESIPEELEEAAMIDGATRFGGRALRLHAGLERVPLRPRVHHRWTAAHAARRPRQLHHR
jgi:multiple sugar transport system permease protein